MRRDRVGNSVAAADALSSAFADAHSDAAPGSRRSLRETARVGSTPPAAR